MPGVERYLARISGPLLDRIDLHVEVPAVPAGDLSTERCGEPSTAIRARVNRARAIQLERFAGRPGLHANAHMSASDLRKRCHVRTEADSLAKQAITQLRLSARAYHRILKLARTIADLAESGDVLAEHVSEAVQYRSLDRPVG